MELDDRQNKIISDVIDLIGQGVITEWASNASTLVATLLRSSGEKPADLEGQLALNYFFLEALRKHFNVDPEIFDLELKKCYRQMEQIIEKAKKELEESAKAAEALANQNPVEMLMGVVGAMGISQPLEAETAPQVVDGTATEIEIPVKIESEDAKKYFTDASQNAEGDDDNGSPDNGGFS